MEFARKQDLQSKLNNGLVQVFNGSLDAVSEAVLTPIELNRKARLLPIRVMKSLPIPFALVLDFIQFFGMQVDFADRKCFLF